MKFFTLTIFLYSQAVKVFAKPVFNFNVFQIVACVSRLGLEETRDFVQKLGWKIQIRAPCILLIQNVELISSGIFFLWERIPGS